LSPLALGHCPVMAAEPAAEELAAAAEPPAAASEAVVTAAEGAAADGLDAQEATDEPGTDDALSFAEHMWDRFDFLWQHRAEPSHRLLEQVTAVLRSRAQLERQYGSSLVNLPDEVQLDSSGGTLHEAVDAIMANFRNRGEQSIELAEAIDNDIVLTLEEVMKQHKDMSKRMFNDAQRLENYCRDSRQAHMRLAKQYLNVCTEAEHVGQECMTSLAMKPAERSRLGARAVQLSKQAKLTQKDYMSSIEQANRAQVLLEQHMPVVLTAFQDMEEKRARCLQDCLMKLAVYDTSWLRNLQYDIDAAVKATENADPEKDIKEFIKKHQADDRPERNLPLTARPFWELGKPRPSQMTQQQRSARVEHDRELKAHAEGLHQMMAGLLAPDSNAEFVQRWDPGLAQLKNNLGHLPARAAFLQVFAGLVIARQSPQASDAPALALENCQPVRIAAACFEVVVTLFLEACSKCENELDSWSGKLMMVLVTLVNFENEGGRIVSLLSRVYNHPVWNKVSFWEETLLVGIFEAHSAEAVWRRQAPNQLTPNAWAVSTPFINKFAWFMAQFGIRGEQARTCVREGLRKHANIMGPALEQYTRNLIQQIDASEAQPGATPQAAVAADAASAYAPRQLEAEAPVPGDASPSDIARGAAPSPARGTPHAADVEDDFGAAASGVQDGYGEASPAPQDASYRQGGAHDELSPQSDSPGSKEPADTLRKLGVDQPSSTDVLG